MAFYPVSARVPEEKRTSRLWLRPLRATDAELDYEAVMSSAEQLRRWSQSSWPADDFTLAENRADLQRHEREHAERAAFTFTVLDPAGARCLGCVYLMPVWPGAASLCEGAAYAASVGFWVRPSEVANDLDRHLLAALREWLKAEWAFDCVLFTLSPQETRQAALLAEAGLERRLAFTLPDGREGWAWT
jgi:RimJ/RimL family protein N-acetyltransferase